MDTSSLLKTVFLPALLLPGALAAAPASMHPPMSAHDGVAVRPAGINADAAHWGGPEGLGAYGLLPQGVHGPLSPGEADRTLGLVWNNVAPSSVDAMLQQIRVAGGIVRAIFVSEDAGWLNDFGYTRTGADHGPGSFTVWQDIEANGACVSVAFGDHFDVRLRPGEMDGFDFWLRGAGGFGANPEKDKHFGGTYRFFDSAGAGADSAQILWAATGLALRTDSDGRPGGVAVPTYLASVEDWRIGRGSDEDYNDFRLALQFYDANGAPLAEATIPEPGMWSALAGLLGFGFVLLRRTVFHTAAA